MMFGPFNGRRKKLDATSVELIRRSKFMYRLYMSKSKHGANDVQVMESTLHTCTNDALLLND